MYSSPSSLLTSTELVNGSTAAVLMHHSFTPPGTSESGVGPSFVMTSRITGMPLMVSVWVCTGSTIATWFCPLPPAAPP